VNLTGRRLVALKITNLSQMNITNFEHQKVWEGEGGVLARASACVSVVLVPRHVVFCTSVFAPLPRLPCSGACVVVLALCAHLRAHRACACAAVTGVGATLSWVLCAGHHGGHPSCQGGGRVDGAFLVGVNTVACCEIQGAPISACTASPPQGDTTVSMLGGRRILSNVHASHVRHLVRAVLRV
jgi:hypothetical protein